jgi:hypothetical protein
MGYFFSRVAQVEVQNPAILPTDPHKQQKEQQATINESTNKSIHEKYDDSQREQLIFESAEAKQNDELQSQESTPNLIENQSENIVQSKCSLSTNNIRSSNNNTIRRSLKGFYIEVINLVWIRLSNNDE